MCLVTSMGDAAQEAWSNTLLVRNDPDLLCIIVAGIVYSSAKENEADDARDRGVRLIKNGIPFHRSRASRTHATFTRLSSRVEAIEIDKHARANRLHLRKVAYHRV